MNKNAETTATATAILNFHGMQMCVVTHEGVDYVCAKLLSDLAGLSWRASRITLQEEDNAELFGIRMLKVPNIAQGGDTNIPRPNSESRLYMRLDRAYMYLSRINTRHMKAKGKVDAARELLALQIEWAEALHQYETTGVAFKRRRTEQQDRFVDLLKAQRYATTAVQRDALNQMINESLADAGYPVIDPQHALAV